MPDTENLSIIKNALEKLGLSEKPERNNAISGYRIDDSEDFGDRIRIEISRQPQENFMLSSTLYFIKNVLPAFFEGATVKEKILDYNPIIPGTATLGGQHKDLRRQFTIESEKGQLASIHLEQETPNYIVADIKFTDRTFKGPTLNENKISLALQEAQNNPAVMASSMATLPVEHKADFINKMAGALGMEVLVRGERREGRAKP